MEDIIFALIPITLILACAATAILRPLSRRLADVLEMQQKAKLDDRTGERRDEELRSLLSAVEHRLELMEQRLDFTESLVDSRRGEGGGERRELSSAQEKRRLG